MNLLEHLSDKDPLVSQYEQNKFLGIKKYYDVDQFSQIIDYYYFSQDLQRAQEAVEDALSIHPASFELLLRKARVLIELKEYELAINLLNFLTTESPQESELFLLLGFSYASLGMLNKAELSFKKLLDLAEDKKEFISFLNDIAYIYFSLKNYQKAYKYYSRAYKLDPTDYHLLYEMAFCLEKQDKNEDSRDLYLKYLKHNPYSKLAWYNLGVVYLKLKAQDKAMEAFDFALAIDPQFSSAIYNKAHLLYEKQRYIESIRYYKKVLKLENNNPSAFFFIAKNLIELKRYHTALRFLQKAIEKVPFFPQAWYEVAKIFYINNKDTESKYYVFKALKQGDLNPEYLKLLGKIYLKEKKYSRAETAFKWAVLANPFDPELWLDYSKVYENEGNYKKAIEILNNSKQFLKDNEKIFARIEYFNNLLRNKGRQKRIRQANNTKN